MSGNGGGAGAPGDLTELVRSAAALSLSDVPDRSVEHAKRVVADTLGVILAGAGRPEIRRLAVGGGRDDRLYPATGQGASQILAPGFPGADPAFAAFVNGTAGTFLELDEGFRPTGHPAVHVVPAALAAAQALGSTGTAFLEAVLGGYEVVARLFEAYRLTYPLHPHGHFGAVGAAVAVARLRGTDPVEPAAVAATLPLLPVWQTCTEGATARNAYAGTAASIGLMTGRLSDAGFRGSREAQRVTFGDLVGELTEPERLEGPVDPDDLGICRNYLKFHSACALNHSALDAVFEIPERPSPEEIESVTVTTVSNNMKISFQARSNDLSTRFSLPYAVAAALVYGHTGPTAFIPDERVATLAGRVTVKTAEDLERYWPHAAPARVTLRTRTRELVALVENPRGHYANPAGADELREKFLRLVLEERYFAEERVPDERRVETVYDRLLNLPDVDDLTALFEGID